LVHDEALDAREPGMMGRGRPALKEDQGVFNGGFPTPAGSGAARSGLWERHRSRGASGLPCSPRREGESRTCPDRLLGALESMEDAGRISRPGMLAPPKGRPWVAEGGPSAFVTGSVPRVLPPSGLHPVCAGGAGVVLGRKADGGPGWSGC
jgi:hypothetical protein